ncbi:hypothetical protein BSKO_08418 [Bryopsis sp. KO-2023]|nr:hypothetical protein BSKO_08418 [Bryopsis sp. KO-2023]
MKAAPSSAVGTMLGRAAKQQPNNAVEPREEEGGMLFTYVFGDTFCDEYEQQAHVTTSSHESSPQMIQAAMRRRKKVSCAQWMFVMADLGDTASLAHVGEQVLVAICAYPDGSLGMRPGFSRTGKAYRFEDKTGCVFEYAVEHASNNTEPEICRREARLVRAANKRVEAVRKNAMNIRFTPPPGHTMEALRLVLMCEIVSGTGFLRDRLYVEYRIEFDPECWCLRSPESSRGEATIGVLQGVTQVSKMVKYPADRSEGTPAMYVAHWAQPIEAELVTHKDPGSSKWPVLLFQVCSYDHWDRYTCEGYGWTPLAGMCPGARTLEINTWKPAGSYRDKFQEYFIGGSLELEDPSYVSVPRGFSGKNLNKYGFETESSGKLKVRVNSIVQQKSHQTELRRGTSMMEDSLGLPRDTSLSAVVERAKTRLREARGGDIEVRREVLAALSSPPVISLEPSDVTATKGKSTKLKIRAKGEEPLRYQWYKDSHRMRGATSDSRTLVIVDLDHSDAGQYSCKVSNKDGATHSINVTLTVVDKDRHSKTSKSSKSKDKKSSSSASRQKRRSSTMEKPARESAAPPGAGASDPGLGVLSEQHSLQGQGIDQQDCDLSEDKIVDEERN